MWTATGRPGHVWPAWPVSLGRDLEHLGVDVLDVVNLRMAADGSGAESIAEGFGTLAEMQKEGLIRHLGVSAASDGQLTEA